MIEIKNISKQYYSLVALKNVSLTIRAGEVLGVLGPNGAGKTTLFKLLAGFLTPDAGTIRSTTHQWPTIGYKPERLNFPPKMRVVNYLRMIAHLSNIPNSEVDKTVNRVLTQVNLMASRQKRIRECSKGMRQRLGLAQALLGDPPLLLLDEPSDGLDPQGQMEIQEEIRALQSAGKTILLSSHQLHEITTVCSHLIILNQGQIHYENDMNIALAERPHATIIVNNDITPLQSLLHSLHPEITIHEREVTLHNEAMQLRRQVMSIILSTGYDIIKVDQKRITLAEIYREVVQ